MAITAGSDIVASDFINVSERNATPTNDAGRVPKLESDARIDGYYLSHFGDGSDGTATLDGTNTYASFLSKSGNNYTLLRNVYFDDLTINSGCTLFTDGFKFYVKGTISGAGTVDWGVPNNGTAGGNGTTTGGPGGSGAGGTGGTGGAASGTGPLKNTAGGDGATGQRGGSLSATQSADAGPASNPGIGAAGAVGGNGGSGQQGGGGGADSGGTVTGPLTKFGVSRLGAIDMLDATASGVSVIKGSAGSQGGAGGSSDDNNNGGGGGGGGAGASGGIVWFAARIWAGTFTIKAIGGNGANGGNGNSSDGGQVGGGGGGAGGSGGVAVVIYGVKTWTGSYNLAGGTGETGGTGVGGGGSGTSGSSGNTGVSYEIKPNTLL